MRIQTRAQLFGGTPEPLRVGRFELRRLLGSGANGLVYAAYDPRLEREIALKLLTLEGDEEARVLGEARAMARVSHPNVLPVYEASVEDGLSFIVSELVEGGTLRSKLASPWPRASRLRALLETGRGLAAGHARGLVHRDVKPENVLIGADGRARVADFGLASTPLNGTTTTGDPLSGTIAYMAPEQLNGQPADPLSDQFSFCVLAWEVLAGERPFRGTTRAELEAAIRTQAPVLASTTSFGPELSVLRRGLSPTPTGRYPSLEALCGELESATHLRLGWTASAMAAVAVLGVGAAAFWGVTNPSVRVQTHAHPTAESETTAVANRLAQEGRWEECTVYLASRSNTEALLLQWVRCAEVTRDPAALERACAAWDARPSASANQPVLPACERTVLQAKALLRAGDYRACADKLLAIPPTLAGSVTLAHCVNLLNDEAMFRRQCRYQQQLRGADQKAMLACDKSR